MIAHKESPVDENPIAKKNKYVVEPQIWLRFFATITTLASFCIIITAKQSIVLYDVHFDAQYTQSSTFIFYAIANLIAFGLSVISIFVALVLGRKAPHPANYFYMFLHDMVVMTLLMAGCASATAIGLVAHNGNSAAGWMPICEQFEKFCSKTKISLILSYLSFSIYLALSIISANKSKQVYVK